MRPQCISQRKAHGLRHSSFNFQSRQTAGDGADAGVTIELAELDVADGDSVRLIDNIMDRAGRVDNLVNNAGLVETA